MSTQVKRQPRLSKTLEDKLMLQVDALLSNTEDPAKVPTRVCFASCLEVKNLRELYEKCLKAKYGKDYEPLFKQAKPVYKTREGD